MTVLIYLLFLTARESWILQGVIFVVDSTDDMRFAVAKDELEEMLSNAALKNRKIPILIFANKMDCPGAVSPVDMMRKLDLQQIQVQPWTIM
jgi:signal recognition particle receptor subunit beta